ncbi:protein kinase domain-containing protein [Cohnella fermenti]|uniref:Uncharacterized protein n=1 Tax=Cohnella fermenti TaxID=2565925 RepID=A0A4S4BHB3_9BACL|nr:hypothetical protein [Cohnella fermenti]THF73933.1 hypothetical protein E6C55_27065 [Cohnella fermenti]
MGFQPEVNSLIAVNGELYSIGQHPQAPGIPYGQEGRQGTVYLLHSEDGRRKKALKVFKSKFVTPSLVHHTTQLAKFTGIAGLAACDRFIVTPQNNTDLLRREPELLYAVVMAWVEGPTWMDILLNRQQLTRREAHSAAFALAQALASMEQRGLAHCDLSGPNVMLPMLGENAANVRPINNVQLIDLEQMYSTLLDRPEHVPIGSPGYAGRLLTQASLWSAHSDRFAGAVLLMEMLASCTDSFFPNAWGESYFAPQELQTDVGRYHRLAESVRTNWGESVASLFVRAWESGDSQQCPTFGEWIIEMAKIERYIAKEPQAPGAGLEQAAAATESSPSEYAGVQAALLRKAEQLEAKEKFKEAIGAYRAIQARNPNSSLAKEVDIAIEALEKRHGGKSSLKRERGKLALRWGKRIVWTVGVLGVLGTGGYYGYGYLKDIDFHRGGARQDQLTLEEAKESIRSLEQSVREKEAAIAQLSKQLEEQKKPMSKRSDELMGKLAEDYESIRKLGNDSGDTGEGPSAQAYKAAKQYMDDLFHSLVYSFNMDEKFVEQTRIVEGYYYPYLYNRNRNTQLNIKFFREYAVNFQGGDQP